jgi:hypothetical protein
MASIFEKIRFDTERSLMKESFDQGVGMKSFTVRLPQHYINALDFLAEELKESRSSLICSLLISAADEAIDGYASAFDKPAEVSYSVRKDAGFPDCFAPHQHYLDFCVRNNRDPEDPETRDLYEEACDAVADAREAGGQ